LASQTNVKRLYSHSENGVEVGYIDLPGRVASFSSYPSRRQGNEGRDR